MRVFNRRRGSLRRRRPWSRAKRGESVTNPAPMADIRRLREQPRPRVRGRAARIGPARASRGMPRGRDPARQGHFVRSIMAQAAAPAPVNGEGLTLVQVVISEITDSALRIGRGQSTVRAARFPAARRGDRLRSRTMPWFRRCTKRCPNAIQYYFRNTQLLESHVTKIFPTWYGDQIAAGHVSFSQLVFVASPSFGAALPSGVSYGYLPGFATDR